MKNKDIVDDFFQNLCVPLYSGNSSCSILTALPIRHKSKLSVTALLQTLPPLCGKMHACSYQMVPNL